MDQNEETGELPLLSAGQQLREAREAQQLTIEAIAARTKIAARQLEAIEADRFSDLASRTYAIGFSRAYARALGLNEARIADAVRAQMAAEHVSRPTPHAENFEPGDPARVPPSLLAWGAGLAFLGLIVVLFLFWRSFVDPAGELPDLISDEERVAQAQASASPTGGPSSAAPIAGPVVVSALEGSVWVKIVDGAGAQLFQKEMALGESFTLPAAASAPMLSTARPQALRVSVGGRSVPQFGDGAAVLRNVPVDAASLLARINAPQPGITGRPTTDRPTAAAPQRQRAAPAAASPPPSASPVAEAGIGDGAEAAVDGLAAE